MMCLCCFFERSTVLWQTDLEKQNKKTSKGWFKARLQWPLNPTEKKKFNEGIYLENLVSLNLMLTMIKCVSSLQDSNVSRFKNKNLKLNEGRSEEGAFKVMFLPFTPRLRSVHFQQALFFCINFGSAFNYLRTNKWHWCLICFFGFWHTNLCKSKQDTFGVDPKFAISCPTRGKPIRREATERHMQSASGSRTLHQGPWRPLCQLQVSRRFE